MVALCAAATLVTVEATPSVALAVPEAVPEAVDLEATLELVSDVLSTSFPHVCNLSQPV